MSGVTAFGLLWAAVGILLGSRWWAARAVPVAPGRTAADAVGPARPRFGNPIEDGSPRRLQAMRLAYAAGALATGLGLATGVPVVLGLGAALLNLGTVYRYLVVALDHEGLDLPVLERPSLLVDAQARPA